MPKAVYVGSAASYTIGPHTFKPLPEGADPEDFAVAVDDNIGKLLAQNEDFTVDGKGGKPKDENGEELVASSRIPSGGFPSRDAAADFAKKWLDEATVKEINFNRSTAEITRRIEAALEGLPVDGEGNILPAAVKAPEAKGGKGGKAKPTKSVPV